MGVEIIGRGKKRPGSVEVGIDHRIVEQNDVDTITGAMGTLQERGVEKEMLVCIGQVAFITGSLEGTSRADRDALAKDAELGALRIDEDAEDHQRGAA